MTIQMEIERVLYKEVNTGIARIEIRNFKGLRSSMEAIEVAIPKRKKKKTLGCANFLRKHDARGRSGRIQGL